MEKIIEVNSLEKTFGNQTALQSVSFDVKKGETFGFLGPSGSGKTTTIKILTGQLLPTSGDVIVFNRPPQDLKSSDYRRKFGVLTDNSGLYKRLTIEENLKLYCNLYDVPETQMEDVLAMVNMSDARKKTVNKLSKGMLQRVLLARALLHEPDLLFLDEPTSSLDPANSKHIHDGLRRLNEKGTTIFLTTHNMSEAEMLCNRVAFLHHGKIQLLDHPKKLRQQFSDQTMVVTLKNGKELLLDQGPETAKTLYEYMSANEIESIHSNEPTLGDIFLEMTGRELV
ncbi:MAG TPA: ABC transporter ATP-binding protein [Tetragenococcus sp.]|nr:ABC transporter ATP-binding protein [Tetragenococcus sp.]